MRPGTFGSGVEDHTLHSAIENFADWYQEIAIVLENRSASKLFKLVLDRLIKFDGEPVTIMLDHQIEEQIIMCSQHKETFIHIAREIGKYHRKLKRNFDRWYAEKYVESRKEIEAEQLKEVKEGLRNKGAYGKHTKDDIHNHLIIKYGNDHERWMEFIEKIRGTHDFMMDVAEDMKDRSIALAGIANRRKEY